VQKHFYCSSECKNIFFSQRREWGNEQRKHFCYLCKKKSSISLNTVHGHDKYGHIFYVHTKCATRRSKNYRQTPSGKYSTQKTNRNNILKFPYKQKARIKVRLALISGKMQKPVLCTNCLKIKKNLHAHHPDYNKPLEVVWLCPKCHSSAHKKLKKLNNYG